MISERINFTNREALAISLARKVSQVLSKAITLQGTAVLAVSGGTTPALFFEHLSRTPISWNKVVVTLVDERQVPEDSPRSNAGLVHRTLLQNNASRATFSPLYDNPAAADLPAFAAAILGMGADGHTASFFPGGTALAQALDPGNQQAILEMSAPGAGEPRLTFTLPRLLASSFLALHIEGAEKQAVLEKAMAGTDPAEMPVRAVLNASKDVHVYWCP